MLGFTRARITQLLDLKLLAPDIQEALLMAEVEPGWDPVTERSLRKIAMQACWGDQRSRWHTLMGTLRRPSVLVFDRESSAWPAGVSLSPAPHRPP